MDPNLNQDMPGGVNSVALNEKHDLSVLEEKVENTSAVVVQKEAEHMVDESMVDNLGSSENVGASNEELKIQENSQSVSVDASDLSNNISSGAVEQSIQNEENNMSFESGPGEKKKSLSFVPNVESTEKLSAKTSILFSENPDHLAPESNVGFLTNISLVKNSSSEENETITGKDALVVSANEKEDAKLPVESGEMDIEVVQGHDTQKNVEPSLVVEKENKVIPYNLESEMPVPNEQVAITESAKRSFPDTSDGHTTAEADDQPKSPIFGVSLVHQDNKETEVGFPHEENSQNEILQVESVVASVSNNPTSLVEKEASHALVEKVAQGIDVHCVTSVENCDPIQIEQNPETNNDNSQTGLQDPKESVIEVSKSNEQQTFFDAASPSEINAKDKQEATKGIVHDSSLPSKIIDDAENKVGKATQEEKNFTFEVNKGAVLGQPGKSFQSYPTFQVSNHKIADGPSKDSSSSQLDAKKLHEVSLSPQNPSILTSQIGVKGKSERKPRRKSTVKENTKKSNNPKEITPSRDSVRGKITAVSLTHPAIDHATHFEAIKSHENVAKPGVVLSSIKLPDLNNSTSIFQQPFTDNQQLQLRAQILVYGSLISGSPPEEPHMIAAFGQSDGGRTWEGVWRACLERLHVQKSQSKSNIPVQPRSGNKADQGIIPPSPQNKIKSSPIGAAANQGTPPTITPMIPLSSPLWKVSTASNNLQSSDMPKTARSDYHQPLSPLHPYQNSPVQNFSALNPSWLSQGPFAGQWVAASPIPAFNPTPHFPPLHVTEPAKVTPVKESGSLGIKHTSNVMVQNSAPASSPEPSSYSKGRKRKKVTPSLSPTSYLPQNVEKVVMSEETLTKVEESKTQAEEANKLAANAASQCHEVWSQLERRDKYSPDDEAKLVSSAVSIAAAASVAKVAAAAAKIASDIADQARSMVNIFLPNKSQNLDQNSMLALVNALDKATPDAIIKAAEMAAETVSQAGKIVAMNEPMSLRDLVEAGPEGYWKTPRLASEQQAVLAAGNLNGTEKKNVESTTEVSDKGNLLTKLGSSGKVYDGITIPFTSYGKDKRKPRVRKGPEMSKSIGAVPESEIASAGTSDVGQTEPKVSSDTLNECNIKEGCLVEVYKDDDKTNGAWFGAKVLDLKDGKALVSYTEIQSDNGQLTEWVPLEVEGTEVPKIRVAHPVTTMRLEGTRKRRRTASTNFAWSIGDRVDVWIQDRWREGVVMETNKIDVTSLTVQFPAQGKTSVVRSWFVRPTLTWKDGNWIECQTSDKRPSSQGDSPQEKRLKLGSPVVSKKNLGSSESSDHVDLRKQEESNTLSLSNHETVFSVGSTRDNKKVASSRTVKSGLQKEGTRVVFGVPKPGKKQKFMDVSRHYVADVSNKKNTPHDSVKFTKYLIPQAPGSRGWKNNSRSGLIEKQAAETKSRLVKSRRPPISTARPLTLPKSTTRENSSTNKMSTDSVSDGENQSRQQNQEIGFSSKFENAPGQSDSVSSLSVPEELQKGVSAKPERLNKRKFAPTGGNAAKVEKLLPEVVEPRRSNRKMQPTSRLLEGLQTSMTISKLPAASHSTPRSQSKVTPKGNTNNA